MLISRSSIDQTIKIWSSLTWTCLKTWKEKYHINSIAIINNNCFATLFTNNIKVWKLKSDYTITKDCEFENEYILIGDTQITLARINNSQIVSIGSLSIQVININI